MMGILLTSFYIFVRAVNYTVPVSSKIVSVLWCLGLALSYAARPSWIPLPTIRPILCLVSILFIVVLTKIKPDTVISAYLLSFGISYCLYYTAVIAISIISAPLVGEHIIDSPTDSDKPLYLLIYSIVFVLHLLLSYLLFRIKRFKNGFPFLLKRYAVVLALISAGTVLAFVTGVQIITEAENISAMPAFFAGVLIIGVGIYLWIRRGIKMFYRKRMKERSIEILEQELAEKDGEIRRLTEQNDSLRVANHKVTHRLAALERGVAELTDRMQYGSYSMEIAEEISITLEDIKRLSQDYQGGISRIKGKKPLPSTKIKAIDDLFGYFSAQCIDSKIDFNLKVSGSIPYMVESVIPQGKLETMIGDHMQDALIAVNACDNSFRSILAVLGLTGDCYEFSVYDSGIPFEPDTLVRLGTECVTTRADTGGSGIGFMTTFETMRETGASLIINEKKPGGTDYTKSVHIRFDGKSRYIIETYRPEEFPDNDDRYVVVGHV